MIEGRDIGTVVFPDAALKLYVTASPHVRADAPGGRAGRRRHRRGDVDRRARPPRHGARRRPAAHRRRRRRSSTRPDLTVDEVVEQIVADARDQGRDVPRRPGPGQPGRLLRGPHARRRLHPAVDPHDDRRARARAPRRARSCWRRCTARTWTRRSRRASPAAGCGSWARTRCGSTSRSAWVLSALGGFPVVRGTADREALQRCIAVLEAGEPLVLFPEGERKSGPIVQPLFDGAAYVALEGRRADRAGRHRRLGARDAQGRPDDPPEQGPRHRRRADLPPAVRRPGPARAVARGDRRAATPRCSACSTTPRPQRSIAVDPPEYLVRVPAGTDDSDGRDTRVVRT